MRSLEANSSTKHFESKKQYKSFDDLNKTSDTEQTYKYLIFYVKKSGRLTIFHKKIEEFKLF